MLSALATAIFGVIEGETAGYGTWWIIALFIVAGICAVGFALVELRTERPVLDLRLLRRGPFTVSNLVAFTTYFGIFSIFFFVALYLQLLAGQSPFKTALDFVPMTVLMIVGSALTGLWVARSGPRIPMTIGCAAAGIGILVVDGVLGPDVGFANLSWSLGLAGVGFGIALVPVVSAAMSSVEPERSGMAASATNTCRELGAVFGVAVLGAIVNAQLTSHLTSRLKALGIPPNFQSVVIAGVTHGGVPGSSGQAAKNHPAAAAAPHLVAKVIGAAQSAFYSGLHTALLISACLLLASAAVVWFTFSGITTPTTRGAPTRSPVARLAQVAALVVVLVGAALATEWVIGPNGGSASAGAGSTTTTSVAKGSSSTASSSSSGPQLTVHPASGLHDSQQVHLSGKGFSPHVSLVALECADRGSKTSSADCDISHVTSVKADVHGKVTATITVRTGPFGSAHRSCGPNQPCEVTVSQPSAGSNAQRATASIAFATRGTG